jgi:prophage regulatory protein
MVFQMYSTVTSTDALIRPQDACALIGYCRSTLYRKVKAGEFPQPVSLGGRLRFSLHEVNDWIEARKAARAEGGKQ